MTKAVLGVIGGSGVYDLPGLEDVREERVASPWGEPSDALRRGRIGGTEVAFLPRHGLNHEFSPHTVPYRANMWALRALGVRQILAPCAVGGLRSEVSPGDVVVPDQLVDRTHRRVSSYVERGAVHLPFADPYCPGVAGAVLAADDSIKAGGTMVVVEGPRFSTRAESRHYAEQGWTLINMTAMPEASLARELRMCYSSLALVTDMDAGAESGSGVGQEEVFARFRENLERLTGLLTSAISALPDPDGCTCSTWADGIELTYEIP